MCPNTEFFLVRIRQNTDQKKLRIWTLFTQCVIVNTDTTLRISDEKTTIIDLHLLHENNNLLSKIHKAKCTGSKSNTGIIGITQTKLDEIIPNIEINLAGYDIFRCDWNRKGCNGVCYIKKLISKISYNKNFQRNFTTNWALDHFNKGNHRIYSPIQSHSGWNGNNGNSTTMSEICLKLIIKKTECCPWRCSANFSQISHTVLVFPRLTLNK